MGCFSRTGISTMRTPIVHKKCGGQIGWFLGPVTKGDGVSSYTFERMDGTHPEKFSMINEKCPKCLNRIYGPYELERLA